MYTGGEKWQLPTTVRPSTSTCVQIQVPDDPAYYEAFWGAFYELGQAFNWDDDGAGTNAQVAEVWDEIWTAAHNGNCEVFAKIRQSLTDTNAYDVSLDNGATWSPLCVKPGDTVRKALVSGLFNIIAPAAEQTALTLDETSNPVEAGVALMTQSVS